MGYFLAAINSKTFFGIQKIRYFLKEVWTSFGPLFNEFCTPLNHRLIFDFLAANNSMGKIDGLGQKTVAAQHFFGFWVYLQGFLILKT